MRELHVLRALAKAGIRGLALQGIVALLARSRFYEGYSPVSIPRITGRDDLPTLIARGYVLRSCEGSYVITEAGKECLERL